MLSASETVIVAPRSRAEAINRNLRSILTVRTADQACVQSVVEGADVFWVSARPATRPLKGSTSRVMWKSGEEDRLTVEWKKLRIQFSRVNTQRGLFSRPLDSVYSAIWAMLTAYVRLFKPGHKNNVYCVFLTCDFFKSIFILTLFFALLQ